VKAIPLVASVLATVLVACSPNHRAPRDEVERRVLDSRSLRQLAIAGDGRFTQAALVRNCLAPTAVVAPPCRAVRGAGRPVAASTSGRRALRIITGAQAATVSVLAGPPITDSVDFTEATPVDHDRGRRWRVRLGKAPAAGDTIVIRVAPLRTDGGSAEFLVQVG
jgi:hypothetical protein